VDRAHGCALHDGRCAACRESHTNFADESAYLSAGDAWNEVVTIHRSQEVLKILSSLHAGIFFCNCVVKKICCRSCIDFNTPVS
jgi:hypothetical protein